MSNPGQTPPPIPGSPPPLPNAPPVIRPGPAKKKPGLSLSVKIILGVVILVFGFFGFRMVQFARYLKDHPHEATPGLGEFNEANLSIMANHGTVAFGNNGNAVALAKDFSQGLKTLRESLFTKGKKDAFSIAKGEFLTCCQWNEDSCVFLVHVPELRRFTHDAKKSLVNLAWMNAQQVIKKSELAPPKTLVVGVRGAILYEEILIGDYVADSKGETDGIKTRNPGIELNLFYPFFARSEPTILPAQNTNALPQP